MKDFHDWLKASGLDESVLGRAAGQVAGRIANVPGRIKNWAGNEIKDFRGGYAQARNKGQQPMKPARPIGPAEDIPAEEPGYLYPGEPINRKSSYGPMVPIGPAEDIPAEDEPGYLYPGEPIDKRPMRPIGPPIKRI